MNEDIKKTTQTTAEEELKSQLLSTEAPKLEQKPTEVTAATNITPTFICPEFVLDFLKDKPIKLQKVILTSKLTEAQKKAVESIFQANEHELEINRIALKAIIEKLAQKYPEIQPWLTNEAVFMGTLAFGFYERAEQVKATLEAHKGVI